MNRNVKIYLEDQESSIVSNLNEGEFSLSKSQAFMLNRYLNSGYKLELEENLNKTTEETLKPKAAKKQKLNVSEK